MSRCLVRRGGGLGEAVAKSIRNIRPNTLVLVKPSHLKWTPTPPLMKTQIVKLCYANSVLFPEGPSWFQRTTIDSLHFSLKPVSAQVSVGRNSSSSHSSRLTIGPPLEIIRKNWKSWKWFPHQYWSGVPKLKKLEECWEMYCGSIWL